MDSLCATIRCSNLHASGYTRNLICHDMWHLRSTAAQEDLWRAALSGPSPSVRQGLPGAGGGHRHGETAQGWRCSTRELASGDSPGQ
jgi:hypothetical protein